MKLINLTRQELALVTIFILSIVFFAFMTVMGAEKQGIAKPIEIVVSEDNTLWGYATKYDHKLSIEQFIH